MRKLSKAPRPTGSLPNSVAAPETEVTPKAKRLPGATSVAALYFHRQFQKAIRTHNRIDAKFYAQKCHEEGLPEPWLTEVFHLRDRLLGNQLASGSTQKRKRGSKPKRFEATVKAMRSMPRADLEAMKEAAMEAHFGVSRDTARRARNYVLSEFVEVTPKPGWAGS
jgi:hypothetical protein